MSYIDDLMTLYISADPDISEYAMAHMAQKYTVGQRSTADTADTRMIDTVSNIRRDRHLIDRVHTALNSLADTYRIALVMRYSYRRLNTSQIAHMLNITDNAFRLRLSRARKSLHRSLSRHTKGLTQ